MPTPGEKTKKKKFVKTPGGKVKVRYKRKHPGKHHCALDKSVLHGMPHNKKNYEVRKLAKTKRRPSVMFGGILSGNSRKKVIEEAVKVKYFGKKTSNTDLRMKKYLDAAIKRIGE